MRKVILAALLAVGGGGSAIAQAAPEPSVPGRISAADFAALPLLQKPKLSPDGRQLAALNVRDGKTSIVVINTDNPQVAQHRYPIDTLEASRLVWAGNHRLLLTVTKQQQFLGLKLPVMRLFAIDVDGGAARLIDRKSNGLYAGDVLYADPTGSWALVASQDDVESLPSVKRVDLASGAATVVEHAKSGVWDWYADTRGVVRAGVSYADRKWTVWYRDQPGEKLRALKGKFDKGADSAVDKFIFRGGESWILTNERTGRFGLYKYDTNAGTLGEAIFEHPEVDVDDVVFDAATGKIKAIEYEDDRKRLKWLDAGRNALQSRIDRALPRAVNYSTQWSDDDKRVLILSYSGSDPGRCFLLDLTTSKMSPVVDPYQQIDPAMLAEVKPVRYQTRDGLTLHAYLTLPKGRPAKGLPLILMPHGGPYERDHWEYDAFVQFLANRGYAVLQPEFRGSTGYGKDFVAKGYGEWGRKMQDDLDDGVDWLARSGQIDPKRVCIVGASYGGYAAMWGAIRNPDRYRCAASLAGVSDLPALLQYDRQLFSAPRYYREWRTKVVGAGGADLKSVSPIAYSGQLKVPLLIGHGEKDERVPPRQSHMIVDSISKRGAPVTSVFYKEAGHGFTRAADIEDWLNRLEQFLAKYNPA